VIESEGPDDNEGTRNPSSAVRRALERWHRDIFGDRRRARGPEEALGRAANRDEWAILLVVITTLVSVDYFVLRQTNGSVKHHLLMVGYWILAAIGYNVYFGVRYGDRDALDWCTGWILEWMLSFDNLFLFHILFRMCKTPANLKPKALFFGIFGAVFMRMLMVLVFDSLISLHHWIRLVFGSFLIYSGIMAVQGDDEDEDLSKSHSVKALRYLFGDRLMDTYDADGRLFPRGPDGRVCISMLAVVIFYVEITDIVFAVDSVSSKVSQLSNQYIVFSSSVLALCGLRAMFFVMEDAVIYFNYLKYGICVILVFIGLELMMAPLVHLDSWTVLIVICSVFLISIAASAAQRLRAARASVPSPRMPELVAAALAHEGG